MAKGSTQTSRRRAPQEPWMGHKCGECSVGVPDYTPINMAHDGTPICVVCPHHKYKRLRNERACSLFREKPGMEKQ